MQDDPSPASAPITDFDLLPYRSVPFQYTQPAHLAAIAALFSAAAPPAATARVLELGCASGGNIIPLAARFPEATFKGVDLSLRHVEEGRSLISDLGLKNVEIVRSDLADYDFSRLRFDYIICHGVYSWVPDHVQQAILRVCAETLADDGIAYISYNVLPGWHLRRIVRDICLFHSRTEGPPQLRVARSRWMLEQVARLSDEKSNFGRVLRDEAKLNATQPDSYILGEFLAEENQPCYFYQFMERAAACGLAYVCDAELADSIPENLGPERSKLIREISGTSGIATEQYRDFFTGRAFRRSLLVKTGHLAGRKISPKNIESLFLSCPLRFDGAASDGERFVFALGDLKLTTNNPMLKEAFSHLAAIYPENCSFRNLVDGVVKRTGALAVDAETKLSQAMFKGVTSRHVAMSTHHQRVGRAGAVRPKIWPVARSQACRGQQWVASLLHTPVPLPPLLRLMVTHLDGTKDHSVLRSILAGALTAGEVRIEGFDQLDRQSNVKSAAAALLKQVLNVLEQQALLEAEPV
jgi:SAM-dependent methyltransferase